MRSWTLCCWVYRRPLTLPTRSASRTWIVTNAHPDRKEHVTLLEEQGTLGKRAMPLAWPMGQSCVQKRIYLIRLRTWRSGIG